MGLYKALVEVEIIKNIYLFVHLNVCANKLYNFEASCFTKGYKINKSYNCNCDFMPWKVVEMNKICKVMGRLKR